MTELIIKKKNTDEKIILDFDSLDFGIGDYFYNGKCSGSGGIRLWWVACVVKRETYNVCGIFNYYNK